MVEYVSPAGTRRVTLAFDGEMPHADLEPNTTAVDEVLDLFREPNIDHWRVEMAVFIYRWPNGFGVESDRSPPGFYIRGPDDSLVYLQGPVSTERLPPLPEMIGPGQTVLGHEREGRVGWVELAYEHDGQVWRQTRRVVNDGQGFALVVTCQSPEAFSEQASAAAREVVASLRPYKGEYMASRADSEA